MNSLADSSPGSDEVVQTEVRLSDRIAAIMKCEEVIIGSIMIDSANWESMSKLVDERDFLLEQHRLMFRTIRLMMNDEIPVTVKSLRDQMRAQLSFDSVYWRSSYYAKLVTQVTPVAYAQTCINIIKHRDGRFDDLAAQVGRGTVTSHSGFISATDYLPQVINDIETAFSNPVLDKIDAILACIKSNKLVVLTGKNEQHITVLAHALVHHCLFGSEGVCAVFCRDPKEFVLSMLVIESQIEKNKLRAGDLNDQGWSDLACANAKFGDAQLYLGKLSGGFESLVNSLHSCASRCEKESASGKETPLFILDLRLVLEDGTETITLDQALSQLSAYAIETGLPIVVVCSSAHPDELASMALCADRLFTLESPIDGNQAVLTASVKGCSLPSKVGLLFNFGMGTVQFSELEKPK